MSMFNSKTMLKHVAVGAALACVIPASSFATTTTTTKTRSGVLTTAGGFSSTTGSLLLLGVSVNAVGTTTESGGIFTPLTFNLPITSVKVAGTGVSSVGFGGAGLEFDKWSLFSTKKISFTDLSLDLSGSGTVFGKIGSTSLALFTGSSVTGSVTGGTTSGSFNYTVSGLKLSAAAATAIGSSLGVSASSLGKISFGSLCITGAIPEPSTYALVGLGLMGAGCVARRRRDTAAA